ncbi:hypothetical protein DLAC_11783 [Tieghemostelium lacteum]|uniref:Methyltransferase type 11 domain-containing protein n=1 Tax=Tieghemostelium lacteum TaxID=361077 RepID=A0A151Z6X2_TIELA|nr:hypothetical protein DLAC_11783 [Tieghemostelium lacteum]|eukprot:KYQ89710.1 hypothetical protein DLAC_11783 [Tieghemostelium lacteum]
MGKKEKQRYVDNNEDDGISPSSYEFWEDFYETGEGSGESYEWYIEYKDLKSSLDKLIKNHDKLLHIGCGNSLLAEELLEDSDNSKHNLYIMNIDVCQNAIDRMQHRTETQISNQRIKTSLDYQYLDATSTNYPPCSYQGVIDKGTCDALLSTLDIEIGENQMVKKLLEEMYRILVPGGFFLCVSRNICLEQYFYSSDDDQIEWQLERSELITNPTNTKKGKGINQVNYIYLAFKKN